MTKRKIFPDAEAALAGVLFDGMTIMSGGFGLSGNPEHLIAGLLHSAVRELTIISNNCGADGFGLWTRSEEHTSELQSLMRISYAVFCLKKKKHRHNQQYNILEDTYSTDSHTLHRQYSPRYSKN